MSRFLGSETSFVDSSLTEASSIDIPAKCVSSRDDVSELSVDDESEQNVSLKNPAIKEYCERHNSLSAKEDITERGKCVDNY